MEHSGTWRALFCEKEIKGKIDEQLLSTSG